MNIIYIYTARYMRRSVISPLPRVTEKNLKFQIYQKRVPNCHIMFKQIFRNEYLISFS